MSAFRAQRGAGSRFAHDPAVAIALARRRGSAGVGHKKIRLARSRRPRRPER